MVKVKVTLIFSFGFGIGRFGLGIVEIYHGELGTFNL